MGALTSNRKRGDDYFSFRTIPSLYTPDSDPGFDNHISKKPRFSSMHHSPDRPALSKSSVSRIYRYPDATPPLRREVHAPCRVLKFGLSARSSRDPLWFNAGSVVREEEERGDSMGNALSYRYDRAKSIALNSLRFVKKDKEVIDVDANEEVVRFVKKDKEVIDVDANEEAVIDKVSEDSSIEEIEVLEDGREGQSTVSNQRSLDNNGTVINVEDLDAKTPVDPSVQPSISSGVTELTNYRMKVENAEKKADSLLLHRNVGIDGVPIHKKLMKSAERLNPKLSSLKFQIDLQEKRWSTLRLLRPAKKPEKVVPQEAFVPLTKEEENEVARAFASANRRRVLVTHQNSNIEISGELMQCLRPGAWLNDEVINVYMELLKEREKRDPKKFLQCHFFNTFFYKKLISGRDGYDFKSVRRWTTQRKLGYSLIDCDKIFVPIHKEIHWCLAVINKKDEKFQYLDSLGGADSQVLVKLARYFVDEVKDKSGKDIDVSSWQQEFVEDLPEQQNGSDCGMFMIKYADFYSRGGGLCFSQDNMPYFRLRTVKEILRLKAD